MRKVLLYSFLVFLCSCTEEQFFLGDPVPKIAFEGLSSDRLVQFQDTLAIQISYEDGDGDLGFLSADSLSLEVWDQRLSKPDFYYIPPMLPLSAKPTRISGQWQVKLKNLFLIGAGSQEQTQFQIRVKDRMGNWSNLVRTPDIIIEK
jgi:hypothetical protein